MTNLRRLVGVTCTVAMTWALAGAVAVAAQTPPATPDAADRRPDEVAFRIDAQPIEGALREFASQANLQLVYETAEVSPNIRSSHVAGAFTPEAALSRLLAHTNLAYKFINDRTVSIRSADGVPRSRGQVEMESVPRDVQPRFARSESPEPLDGSSNHSVAAEATTENDIRHSVRRNDIEEVLVTAQKRTERLQDVPVPVTAISAQTLVEANQLRLQDYYTSIPGLSVTPRIGSQDILAIRGITTGPGTNPTVGVTVDDVPYGASTLLGGGLAVPDIDPGDLRRVEVLRGPQGTLYGASSMGGLLKFVTVDPSTDGLSGRVQAGTSSVHNGDGLGYNFRGSVNVPLGDTLAVRASGFTRRDPGYIDNPILQVNGVNEQRVNGGRLSALWRPSADVSLKVSALYQDARGDGSSDADTQPGLRDLQQNYVRGVGSYRRKVQSYSATLTAKLGSVNLTAVSGYNVNAYTDSFDLTYALGTFTLPQFGVTGTPVTEDIKNRKFTQEIRLSGSLGMHADWLVGTFYTHESPTFLQNLVAADPLTGAQAGLWYESSFPTTYSEYAGFVDLTYHFTDQFDIQLGGRESHIEQTASQTYVGIYDPVFLGAPSPVIYPQVRSNANAFTYLVTPRLKLSSDLMIYVRLASGYRPGGPNAAPDVPRLYSPDKTQNYEIGVKGDFLDHTLSMDTSLYYIDWKDIQVPLTDPKTFEGYTANGRGAKSEGLELSVESRPLTGLTMATSLTWGKSELTADLPVGPYNAYGISGDRLPYSSRFSGTVSLQQDFTVSSSLTGFVGGALSYVGDREGLFTSPPTAPRRQNLPAYAKTDLRAGARYRSMTITFFINNVADRRGVLNGGLGESPPFAFTYVQPRTLGLSLVETF
jgi:iron complex outermembrane recepter protein